MPEELQATLPDMAPPMHAETSNGVTVAVSHIEVCPVTLTEAEVAARGRDLSIALGQLEQIDVRKKAVIDDLKAEAARQQQIVANLGAQIRRGAEDRDVSCHLEYDWPEGRKRLYREDTGQLVDSQAISDRERQDMLKFPEPEKPAEAEKVNGANGEAL